MATPNLANITTITPLTFLWNTNLGYNWIGQSFGPNIQTSYVNNYISGIPGGILQNLSGSNSVIKINTIIVNDENTGYTPSITGPQLIPTSFVNGGGAAAQEWTTTNPAYYVNLSIFRGSAGASYTLYRNPFQGSVVAIDKNTPIYLGEGDAIACTVANPNNQYLAVPFSVVISYESMY
jgi:hypothetical protein